MDIDNYKCCLLYSWGKIFVVVYNLKLKQYRELFKKTIPNSAAEYEPRRQIVDPFDDVYLSI
jgi:hypothetical protein